ncbi:MAG: GatB/YqeY domain-containing protein [Actinomycetota bacterium]|nr:GatB/YqeY domain-containing protein [Actinomycetota bacterium]MDQ3648339.1 GatB/YqeY domain-containing protein [Actinomycetota bacterium]
MTVLQKVQDDAAAALKAGDRERAGALRLIVSELQKAEKEASRGETSGAPLHEADELAVLQRERKRRVEAAEAYESAGRDDLAAGERREVDLIDPYLPAQLEGEELELLVDEAVAEAGASSPKDMGRVMSAVMPRVAGRADGKRVSAVVRERLPDS